MDNVAVFENSNIFSNFDDVNKSNAPYGLLTRSIYFYSNNMSNKSINKTIKDLIIINKSEIEISSIIDTSVKQAIKESMNEVFEYISSVVNGPKIAEMLLKHSPYTFAHCIEVACISIYIAYKAEMEKSQLIEVGIAGLLHDIGKLFIDKEILEKKGKLSFKEMCKIKKHPYYGYSMLKHSNFFSQEILEAVLSHHETDIGNGYPNSLRGNEICDYAKIVAIADVFNALTSKRNYRTYTWNIENALKYVENNSNVLFSQKYAKIFVNSIKEKLY